MAENKNTKLQIRNSTVDFLVFTKDAHEEGIEVRVQDHDVWLTQKAIGQLFDVDRSVVTKHLKNIYESGELSEESTCANFAQVAFSSSSSAVYIFFRCLVMAGRFVPNNSAICFWFSQIVSCSNLTSSEVLPSAVWYIIISPLLMPSKFPVKLMINSAHSSMLPDNCIVI